MGSKIYLVSAAILLALLFTIVVLPYLAEYMRYSRSLKSFGEGASISYSGNINLWAIHRNAEGVIDYEVEANLRFYLNVSYERGEIYASLSVYNESSNDLVFSRTVSLDRSSSLILFLIPHTGATDIAEYGHRIYVCPKPGPTRFGGPLGTPSEVGVPKQYLGVLVMRNDVLAVTDGRWSEDWQCSDVVKRRDTGVFYRYGRLENGYILLSYTAYYGATVGTGNSTIAEVFREYGSPLINMLIDTFGVDPLRTIVDEIRSSTSLSPEVVREGIYITKSNVYPLDQDWYGGVSGLYMGLTPLTQLMTVASVVLLVLYFRRR